ncbi:MAG: hypothetical protein SV186_03340 [Candidatus Nanohaloarchaea archaeon]|nr:hypothetical protein [Candidatus Nanohaloarchaea archaeon]
MRYLAAVAVVVIAGLVLLGAADDSSRTDAGPRYGSMDGPVEIQKVRGETGNTTEVSVLVERRPGINDSSVPFGSFTVLLRDGGVVARGNVSQGVVPSVPCPEEFRMGSCRYPDARWVMLSYNGSISDEAVLELWGQDAAEFRDAIELHVVEVAGGQRIEAE